VKYSYRNHELTFLFFCCRYHTGSLAFGAAIIAIVQLIMAILEYIDAKLKGKARFSDIFWRETWQRNEDLPVVNSGCT